MKPTPVAALLICLTACGSGAGAITATDARSSATQPTSTPRATHGQATVESAGERRAEPSVDSTAPASSDADDRVDERPTTVAPTNPPASTESPTTEPMTAAQPTVTAPVRSGAPVSPTHEAGRPLSISIPALGAAGPIVPTGYLPDGTVDVPDDPATAGWFEPGPRPGERGPAVVMGHVDSRSAGPGVFFRLRELSVGDVAVVDTETGPIRFVVTAVEQYPKDEFPTDRVYGPVPGRELRLITCGGSFDDAVRSYRDNIIAFLVPEQP